MKNRYVRIVTGIFLFVLVSGSCGISAEAKTASSVLPSAGMAFALDDSMTNDSYKVLYEARTANNTKAIDDEIIALAQSCEDVIVTSDGTRIDYSDLVIAQVNHYVNVRDIPDAEQGEVVGKLYNDSVGTLIKEENGWYQITSGNCTGWVKGEYCVSGEAAVELVPEVGTTYATVTTTTLKVRSEAGLDASCIGMIPMGDDFIVLEDLDGWVKISTEDGEGYVSKEYVELNVEFVYAESKAEEEARLAKEAEERKKAQEAAARKAAEASAAASTTTSSATASTTSTTTYSVPDSGYGSQVAEYALQFVGNPYVYGGTSLTNGADCSGFVMSVYANFGVSLPHSSKADRSVGSEVEGGLANAQPGDLVCYSGHVALYIGNGQIVHASTKKTGIIVSNADYKTPITVRRIF